MKKNNFLFKVTIFGLMLLANTTVFAENIRVSVDENDVAVSGYDTVAYFVDGLANEGSADYTVVHEGAIYRFESKKNRDLFRAAPEKYVPQYGGHCAYGVTKNRKFEAGLTPNSRTLS